MVSKLFHLRAQTGPTAHQPQPRCGSRHTDVLLAQKTPNPTTHHPSEHTNQDTKRRQSRDKDPTANRTEHQRKRNPTGKPWRARQTAKAPGPHHSTNRQAPQAGTTTEP